MTPRQRLLLFSGGDKLTFHAPLLTSLVLAIGTGSATFTRATTATVWGYDATDNWTLLTCASGEARFQGARRVSQGNWSEVLSNGTPIGDSVLKGFHGEGTRTNYCLWNRDLTNAAWTALNCTATKDQTGIDGVANSATRLTVTVELGTCLQSITRSSAQRITSCWIKRITGSGTVEMTQDNGATWTPVTVTGNWALVSIPAATAANPIIGFRLSILNDEIAVDYVQHEEAAFFSSSIATTTAAVTRNGDILNYPTAGNFFDSLGSAYAEYEHLSWGVHGVAQVVGATNGIRGVIIPRTNTTRCGLVHAASNAGVDGPTDSAVGRIKGSSRWGNGTMRAFSSGLAGSEASYDGSFDLAATMAFSQTTANIFFGYLRNVKFWGKALADSKLQALTA
jgi:hypothetical protein